MQVLILHEDAAFRDSLAATLRARGHSVHAFDAVAPARDAAREGRLDLLVMAERIDDRLTHDLALLAEWRNPDLSLLLLSDREGLARAELFDLLPALKDVLPAEADEADLARRILAVTQRPVDHVPPATAPCHDPRYTGRPDHRPASRHLTIVRTAGSSPGASRDDASGAVFHRAADPHRGSPA
jgi:DNA-binding response OmpR family regulator